MSQPWVEKFRPTTLRQVSGQTETVAVLERSIQSQNLPHLLFYGQPGTGKTSTILALAKDLYGPELYKARVLELNASDERGIEIIRTKVKQFAQIAVAKGKGPPYKLIILDEADSMTIDAQSALRRTMETYSHVTRFCLICNYLSRIIEPLASRCAKFRFKPLDGELMMERLEFITSQEGMEVPTESLNALVDVSGGDLRQAITLLQTASRMTKTIITPEQVYEMTGTIPKDLMDQLMDAWEVGKVEGIHQKLKDIFHEGYSGLQLLAQVHTEVTHGSRLSTVKKAKVAVLLGKTEKRLFDGADEELQLLQLLVNG